MHVVWQDENVAYPKRKAISQSAKDLQLHTGSSLYSPDAGKASTYIFRLPVEILQRIFLFCQPPPLSRYCHPASPSPQIIKSKAFLPARVCRAWHAISLMMPELSPTIMVTRKPCNEPVGAAKILSSHLSRFLRCTVHPTFNFHYYTKDSHNNEAEEIVRLLADQSSRWRSVTLSMPFGCFADLPSSIRGHLQSLQRLELLSTSGHYIAEHLEIDIFQDAPALHTVEFIGFIVRLLPWSQIKTLILSFVTLDDCLYALGACENLYSCHFIHRFQWSTDDLPHETGFSLPITTRMRHLKVTGHGELSPLLQAIRAPYLTSIEWLSQDSQATLPSWLAFNKCYIQHLALPLSVILDANILFASGTLAYIPRVTIVIGPFDTFLFQLFIEKFNDRDRETHVFSLLPKLRHLTLEFLSCVYPTSSEAETLFVNAVHARWLAGILLSLKLNARLRPETIAQLKELSVAGFEIYGLG
ncbi:hypothetical protein FISHEDRAFT_57485 [Fistulina hepatica ATCC 64428]|uniref:F-box domain-containing protein n=1 Tax=Fistulina hepatica ATCC 64428 TaxID=1128425 RepID=A0A0D7AFF1_9AGAR|nr:hypothetical protein FISHEDRAFT_57485 [Fistulina hepatica ATCC 64428]